jgi:hypothetical protein
MGTLIGLLIGLIFYGIHRWLPTTASIEIILTLGARRRFPGSGVIGARYITKRAVLSISQPDSLYYFYCDPCHFGLPGIEAAVAYQAGKPEDRFTVIPAQKQEMIIQKKIAHRSLLYLREKYGNNMVRNEHLDNLLDRLEIDLNFFQQDPEEIKSSDGNTLSNYQRIYLDLLDQHANFFTR